jgi:methylglutaconyl-CoA hydratase
VLSKEEGNFVNQRNENLNESLNEQLNELTTVRFSIDSAGVAEVLLNRPSLHNSFQPVMIRELTNVFRALTERSDVRTVILRGEGKSFCAGADLSYMQEMANFSFEENRIDAVELHQMFWAIRSCPHPIIGKLHGNIMGGGVGLAAVCDLVAATSDSKFCFSEVKLGIAPAVISPFVLERMQSSSARRYMLTGEVFDANTAQASGLVHYVGDVAAVDEFVNQALENFKQNSPESMRATKMLLQVVSESSDWAHRSEITTQVIAELRVSPEGQKRLRGFLNKCNSQKETK